MVTLVLLFVYINASLYLCTLFKQQVTGLQKFISTLVLLLVFPIVLISSEDSVSTSQSKKWYDSFSIRGYMQFRYNRLLETNSQLRCEQCDRSWGENGGFFFRRIRLIFFGQISEQVYFYLQPDLASSASSTGLHFGQIRDAYFDIGLEEKNEFRIRLGQSKVPFGFENMQSSQNRLPLDRSDALNSAFSNEREIGAFFYWAPQDKRKLYTRLINGGLKGSGDYGVVDFGVFNGQLANRPEGNNNLHVVGRINYPFEFGNQIVETGIYGYTGKYVMSTDQLSTNVKRVASREFLDQRVGATINIAPQPFGLLAEYNVGKGPEFNKNTDSIEITNLHGGFVTASYLFKTNSQTFLPFLRAQYYDGGKKQELDARSYEVKELEFGIEWQPVKQFEIVTSYVFSSRRFEDFAKKDNIQTGSLLRLQAQINY